MRTLLKLLIAFSLIGILALTFVRFGPELDLRALFDTENPASLQQEGALIQAQKRLGSLRAAIFDRSALTDGDVQVQTETLLTRMEEDLLTAVIFRVSTGEGVWYRSGLASVRPEITEEDSLFYKADPFADFIRAAQKHHLSVYALLDAGTEPDTAALVTELMKQYRISGVILENPDPAAVPALISQTSSLGLLLGENADADVWEDVMQSAAPAILLASGSERWREVLPTGTKICELLPPEDTAAGSTLLSLRTRVGKESESGFVIEDYYRYLDDPEATPLFTGLLRTASAGLPELNNLEIPRTLAVTYPADRFETTGSTVFIMGTSDPAQPLLMDGEEIVRGEGAGCFGILVELGRGENIYTFTQGSESAEITIIRTTGSTGGISRITRITQNSAFPQDPYGVDSNETITLSCIAPAGGKVTAELNGRTVVLAQAAAAQQGVPAVFSGKITLDPNDYPRDETISIGAVTYTLTYNGEVSRCVSQGEVFVAGWNVPLMIRQTSELANLLRDEDDDESIYGTFKQNAVLKVSGKEKTSRDGESTIAYRLADGGYVLGWNYEVVTGTPLPDFIVPDTISVLSDPKGETLVLCEQLPGVISSRSGNRLILDFYGASFAAQNPTIESEMIESAELAVTDFGCRMTLALCEDADLWGWHVSQIDGRTELYLKRSPVRSDDPLRPLDGITVMLDAGHGGSDVGALGIAQTLGPDEADLNLAVVIAAKYCLEQLGAEVTLTRSDDLTPDIKYTIYQRLAQADEEKPDIFLSVHHNSAALTRDHNVTTRMEAYYFEPASAAFAEQLMTTLPALLDRAGEAVPGRYYVTRMTYAPAVLLEVGFVINPWQYEECSDPSVIYTTGCGIAQSILAMIPEG